MKIKYYLAILLFAVGCGSIFNQASATSTMKVEVGDCKAANIFIIFDSQENMAAYQIRNCAQGRDRFCGPIMDGWFDQTNRTAYVIANKDSSLGIAKRQLAVYCGWKYEDKIIKDAWKSSWLNSQTGTCEPSVMSIDFKSPGEIAYLQRRNCQGGDDQFCGKAVDGWYDPNTHSAYVLANNYKSLEIAWHELGHHCKLEDPAEFKFHCFGDPRRGGSGANPMDSGRSSCMK